MNKSDIYKYKPLNNNVLVMISGQYQSEVILGSGDKSVKINIDTSYDPEHHTTAKGRIVAIPEKLTFGNESHELAWKTNIEVAPGDEVYFTWMAVAHAFSPKGSFISDGENFYINVRYDHLTLKKIGDEIVMLNGYCLVEEIPEDELPEPYKSKAFKQSSLILPAMVGKKKSSLFGRIIAVGSCNERYLRDAYHDDDSIGIGDLVVYDKNANIPVQYDIYADLIGKKKLFKIQRRHMFAIVK